MSKIRCFMNIVLRGNNFYLNRTPSFLSNRKFPEVSLVPARNYAKGKDKKKEEKGKGMKKKLEINENLLMENIDFEKMKTEMDFNIQKLQENFTKYLSLRTSAGAIENLIVVYDGKKYPLIEVAQIIRNNPKVIILNMSSFPQVIPAVLKSIEESGMNLNPQQDGTTISFPVPMVTKEYRETLAKNAKAHFVKCRDGIKETHMKYVKTLKNKEKTGLSQDVARSLSDQIKQLADVYVTQAEDLLQKKQRELLGN